MAEVNDALAGVFERLPVFDQALGAFEIVGEDYVAARVVGDGKVAIPLTIGEGPERVEPLHEDLFDDAEDCASSLRWNRSSCDSLSSASLMSLVMSRPA